MEINTLLQQITNTCKLQMTSGDWGKNEAMRYAYVTLGKELSKSARFFFSIEGKYGEHGLSIEDMKKIHYADSNYEVTCYVSAKMLKDIFGELEIESHIMQSAYSRPYTSNGETLDIYHSYLLCVGDDDKKYFLSLNSDLVNIKLNAPLEHFAVKIPYIYNGKQSYQGEEIPHSTLSDKELLEIDKKIGYAIQLQNPFNGEDTYVYANVNDPKHDIFGRQKEPFDYLLSQLPYLDQNFLNDYEALCSSFIKPNGESKTNFSELALNEIRQLEWYVFDRCLQLTKLHLDISSNDEQEYFFSFFNSPELDIKELHKEVNNFIKQNLNDKNSNVTENILTNPFRIISSSMTFIKSIESLSNTEELKKLTDFEKENLRLFYNENKLKVSKLFLSQETLDMYCGNRNPSNEFLVSKLLNCIESDFECETSKICGYRPIFSTKMQAVEQAKFLKDYLRTILKTELPTESDFLARIMFSSLAELTNPDKNAFLIHVKPKDTDSDEPSYSIIYNPNTNTINLTNFLAIRQKYKILSKTVNEQVNRSARKNSQTQVQGQQPTSE